MAKKTRPLYVCAICGTDYSKWMGKCLSCNNWNTIEESTEQAGSGSRKKKVSFEVSSLSQIKTEEYARLQTTLSEFNLVCGGGIVPGGVVLIGGEPGIGKSTLALQVANSFKTLYFSGEESAIQIKHRAVRLNIEMENIFVSSNTIVEDIEKIIEEQKPECIFIDSIQTIVSAEIPGPAGSVSQIRESANKITDIAKQKNIPLFIIGHITKEGNIAGPKILEHIVDTVLYFEGDFSKDYRILRAFKNRFGSVNEIGLFQMTANGLQEIKNKNSLFLDPYLSNPPGNAVCAALEGSRTILFEVQSLVTSSAFPNPRRMSDGFDLNRLVLMLAVLEKHVKLKLSAFDVFLNVAGGFQINEPAADLAVTLSVVSSLKNEAICERTCLLGEISLSGEIRPVSQIDRRVQEAIRNGFKILVVSKKDAQKAKQLKFEGKIIEVKNIAEAVSSVF